MTSTTPATTPAAAARQHFFDAFRREHATTMKVLRAFPADKSDFRPHETSNRARDLAFTFVLEQRLLQKALTDQLKLGGGWPQTPDDYNAIVDDFDREFEELCRMIEETSDESWGRPVQFPVGPGKVGDWDKLQFAWFMLCDQIHHRGQMSVYLRMVGGKVPSIYGPSKDDPWF
ncbi:MAG TPA: DinB family protein [Gemmatimonadaceae bacterium]